jgi:hypothetical protein
MLDLGQRSLPNLVGILLRLSSREIHRTPFPSRYHWKIWRTTSASAPSITKEGGAPSRLWM